MSAVWSSRWAAVGAAVAITLGAGGLGIAQATTSSGERPIYQPINPCRLADIRPAPDTVGNRTSPLGPEETYTLQGWGDIGNCSLPNGTAGLALNVTAVAPSQATFLTLFPAGESLPLTSNLNPTPGQPPTPNAVNVDLGTTGAFNVFNRFGDVYVIIDVVGYYDDHNHDDRYYTEDEVDAALGDKADAATTYTQDEVDTALADKADAATTYTQDEIDAQVATVNDRQLGAVVDASGNLVRGFGATGAARVGPGNFRAFFDRDISECIFAVTPGQPGNSGTARDTIVGGALLSTDATGLYISVEDPSGADKDQGFHVIVLC